MELLTDPRPDQGKIGAHCPFHLEGTPGGAFFYDPREDVGHCYSCGTTGDLLDIYCALTGRPFRDPDGFREFRDKYAPGETGQARRDPRPRREPVRREWAPREVAGPSELWSARAGAFVAHSEARLADNAEVMAQLERWGLDEQGVRACRFGWNDRDKYVPVTSWGLPYAQNGMGKEKKIWLPEGLVTPYAPGGVVQRVMIRRPNPEAGPAWAQDKRYQHVRGGASPYFMYGRPDCRVWVIIETTRDAAMVWWRVRSMGVGTMGICSVSARPDQRAAQVLRRADCILLSIDLDGAGAQHVGWWKHEYPQMVRVPVPARVGKDPGDLAVVDGGEAVGEWVREGIPSHVRRDMERAAARARGPVVEESDATEVPVCVREAVALLGKCPISRAVLVVTAERTGLAACDRCPQQGGCELPRELGHALFTADGADELQAWIEERGGRLACWEVI